MAKYFIKLCNLPEKEVTKDEFIQYELSFGFFSKIDGETATSGFAFQKGIFEIKGRIEYTKQTKIDTKIDGEF